MIFQNAIKNTNEAAHFIIRLLRAFVYNIFSRNSKDVIPFSIN